VQLNGVFGAFRDAVPDHWGRPIIEKHAGKARLDEMDYLLEPPDDRAGALGLGLNQVPPAPLRTFNKTLDLAKLQELADALINDEIPDDPAAPQVQEFILLGTSMGGAVQKPSFRTMKVSGLQNLIARTIAGTTPVSSTARSSSRGNAESALPKAGLKTSAAKTSC